MADIDISLVIVSWNAKDLLRECLESIPPSSDALRLETIVVDNGSTDGSPEAVEAEFPETILVRNEKNLGFSAANNIGIRKSSGRYVCLVNSDVVVLPGCLEKMLAYMDAHREVGLAGPLILWPDKTVQDSCRKFPGLWNNLCMVLGLSRLFPKASFFSSEHMKYFAHDRTREVDALVGCFLMVRREAIDQVGMLDEDFFIYAEELDWCKRLRDAGWRIDFYPEAEAIHYGRGSSSNAPSRFAVEQQKAILHLWRKHKGKLVFGCFILLTWLQWTGRLVRYFVKSLFDRARRAEHREAMAVCRSCLRLLRGSTEPSPSS